MNNDEPEVSTKTGVIEYPVSITEVQKPNVQNLIGRPRPTNYPLDPDNNSKPALSYEIRSILKREPKYRPQALTELRDYVAYYKEGVATLQNYLIELIIEDPAASLNELNSTLDAFRDELGISPSQYQLFRYILSEYHIRHQELEAAKKRYTDQEGELDRGRLFVDTFGFEPTGEIGVVVGPLTFSFYCGRLEDFVSAYNAIDIRKLAEEERGVLLKSAKSVGGVFMAKEAPLFDLSLMGSVVLINLTGRTDEDIERINTHEQEHAITDFLTRSTKSYIALKKQGNQTIPPDLEAFTTERRQSGSIDQLHKYTRMVGITAQVQRLKDHLIEKELKLIFLDERREAEELIKSELLSFLVDGSSKGELNKQIDNYNPFSIDWMRSTINDYTKITGDSYRDVVKKQVYLIFHDQFNHLVFEAIQSLYSLEDEVGSTEKALTLLRAVPLRKWRSEAERIIKGRIVK